MEKIKIVSLVVLFSGLCLGIYSVWSKNSESTVLGSEKSDFLIKSPEETVENFYNWWIDYFGYPPLRSPLRERAYRDNFYISEKLSAKIDGIIDSFTDTQEFDPVLCARGLPNYFNVGKARIYNEKAFLTISENFWGNEKQIEIILKMENKKWQLDDIACISGWYDSAVFNLYFRNMSGGDSVCGNVAKAERKSVNIADLPKMAIKLLLSGPSEEEKSAGFVSLFSWQTADILNNIKIRDSVAYVDLKDVRHLVFETNPLCLKEEIENTLKQFRGIGKVFFAFEGSPKKFYEWLRIDCPTEIKKCDGVPFK